MDALVSLFIHKICNTRIASQLRCSRNPPSIRNPLAFLQCRKTAACSCLGGSLKQKRSFMHA